MLMPVVISGAIPSITRTATPNYTGGSATTITFSSQSFGTAGRRHIIAAVGWSSSATTATMTIGGVSATQVASSSFSTTNTRIFIASVPTGTTGDVVTTLNSGTVVFGMAIYAVYNLRSATAVDTASAGANYGAGGTITLDSDLSARGVAVSVLSGVAATPSVSGMSNQVTIRSGLDKILAADYTTVAAETPRAMRWSVNNGNSASLATFR